MDESATNSSDRFEVQASSSIPPGTAVPCTLHVTGDSADYEKTFVFSLTVGSPQTPGQYVITLDTGAVSLSVCGIGSIGYDEPPQTQFPGTGFQVPKGAASSLFFGALMVGNSESYLVDHFYSQPANSGTNHDWQMTDSFRIVQPPTPADEHWVNTMSDGGHSSPKGLDVEQHWYMNADEGYNDFAIVTFDFENNGSNAINGLYAGMVGDFDVGTDPRKDDVNSDTIRRAVWMKYYTSDNPTVGLVILDPTSFAALSGINHRYYI
ncbi:hypothetical protein CH330_08265, partial [candidate division WOR-3 bacterium JGI_Cruoil_03_51_56]